MSTDLFKNEPPVHKLRTFTDFVRLGDKKAAIDYLRNLNQTEFHIEVLKSGLSMISFRHGKNAVFEHVIKQFK